MELCFFRERLPYSPFLNLGDILVLSIKTGTRSLN
jgi:hypothetical protein